MNAIDDPPTSEHAFNLEAEPEMETASQEEPDVIDDAFDHMGADDDNDDAGK